MTKYKKNKAWDDKDTLGFKVGIYQGFTVKKKR
jgi:hypothetical protein